MSFGSHYLHFLFVNFVFNVYRYLHGKLNFIFAVVLESVFLFLIFRFLQDIVVLSAGFIEFYDPISTIKSVLIPFTFTFAFVFVPVGNAVYLLLL